MVKKEDNFSELSKEVFFFCEKIPRGKVTTYKEIAKSVGSPNASRAVGNVLNKNTDLKRFPCHRVVRSDGSVGGYVFGTRKKIIKLMREGVKVDNNKIDLEKFLFKF